MASGIIKCNNFRYGNESVARHEDAMINTDNDYKFIMMVLIQQAIDLPCILMLSDPESSVEVSPWMLNGE